MSRSIEHIRHTVVEATLRMPLKEWNWSEGVALYGLSRLWETTRQDAILLYLQEWYEQQVSAGSIAETVNATAPCFTLLAISQHFPDERYARLLEERMDFFLNRALRLQNGAYEHILTETSFGGQMWVDTLFMAGLFLVESGLLSNREAAVLEGIRQFAVHAECLQADDGLFYHGWDETKGRVIGSRWARGNAWATIVAVELLRVLPEAYSEGRIRIKSVLDRQLRGLRLHQDISGLWPTVITEAQTYLETSAAAGIAYAVLRGVRSGAIDPSFMEMGVRAYRAVCAHTDYLGVLNGVSSGTAVQSHPGEYHVIANNRMEGYGQGLLLMMLSEELPNG